MLDVAIAECVVAVRREPFSPARAARREWHRPRCRREPRQSGARDRGRRRDVRRRCAHARRRNHAHAVDDQGHYGCGPAPGRGRQPETRRAGGTVAARTGGSTGAEKSHRGLADTSPDVRAITLRHLLTNTSAYGIVLTECALQRAMADSEIHIGVDLVRFGADEWLARHRVLDAPQLSMSLLVRPYLQGPRSTSQR
jgi:hypothetical protein